MKKLIPHVLLLSLIGCAQPIELNPTQVTKPISCNVYDLGYYPSVLPVFSSLSPTVKVGLDAFSLGTATNGNPFPALVGTEAELLSSRVAFRCKGLIAVTAAGNHVIKVTSDDGVRVILGGLKIIENNTTHAATTNSATVTLEPGMYQLTVEYFQGDGDKGLTLSIQDPQRAL